MSEEYSTNGLTREEYMKEIKRVHSEMRKLVDSAANPNNDLSTFREILLEGDKLTEDSESLLFSAELWDGLFGVLPASDGLKYKAAVESMNVRNFNNVFFCPMLSIVAKIAKDSEALAGINERVKEKEESNDFHEEYKRWLEKQPAFTWKPEPQEAGSPQQQALARVVKRTEEAKAEKERGGNLMDACSTWAAGWTEKCGKKAEKA